MKWTGFILSFVIVSCALQPKEEYIQTTIANTEKARPSITLPPSATISPTKAPTNTRSPTKTLIPSKTPKPSPTTLAHPYINPPGGYELASPDCTIEECLFRGKEYTQGENWLIGIAFVEGYYASFPEAAYGEEKNCDAFVVTGGSQTIIDSMRGLIYYGNGIYKLNEFEQVIFFIDLDNMDVFQRQLLVNSTQNFPVRLLGFWPTPEGSELDICEPWVITLSVE